MAEDMTTHMCIDCRERIIEKIAASSEQEGKGTCHCFDTQHEPVKYESSDHLID